MEYKVSVIVPIYNVSEYIEKCARSLFDQSLREIQFVFVDDFSSDDSINKLRGIIRQYPSRENDIVLVQHSINRGLWYCRSEGLKLAKGDYVIHCDSDDWVSVDMYERMYNMAKEEQADIVMCGYVEEYNSFSKTVLYPYLQEGIEEINYFGTFFPSVCNKLVKLELYQNNSIDWLPGVSVWEDLCVSIPLRLFSKRTVCINEGFYHYRKTSNSLSLTNNESKLKERIKAVSFVDSFVREHNLSDKLCYLIIGLKKICKDWYISGKDVNPDAWRELFPEVNCLVWKYEKMLKHKLLYWSIYKKIDFIPKAYLFLINIIK